MSIYISTLHHFCTLFVAFVSQVLLVPSVHAHRLSQLPTLQCSSSDLVSQSVTLRVVKLGLALPGRLELLFAVLFLVHLLHEVHLVLTLHALAPCHVSALDSLILTRDLLGEHCPFRSGFLLVFLPKFHLGFGLRQLLVQFFALLLTLLNHASYFLKLFIILLLVLCNVEVSLGGVVLVLLNQALVSFVAPLNILPEILLELVFLINRMGG
jgi:hypothetical protein